MYHFVIREKDLRLVSKMPDSNRAWKSRFFFVKGTDWVCRQEEWETIPHGYFDNTWAFVRESAHTRPLITDEQEDFICRVLEIPLEEYDVDGYVTGFGNPDWARTHPAATSTAPAVSSLLRAGATCIGKTVMDEMAYSIEGENIHYGTPRNPCAPDRIPGGSSSGSAVAVAAKLVDFALGSDTGGSVRVPASYCGILGFRPSHDVVSTNGVIPMAQSFDSMGKELTI
ncbi:amidase 1-like [Quercus suber]|uniref:amidase 1-like n=1 Tax=Quercus suber TaxID=58331 RepID=UPI0032DEE8E3